MTTQYLKGFRYAALARGESLMSPDTCDCCGRTGLKKTIKLINPSGNPVWFGCGCAAKAMGIGIKIVDKARIEQVKTLADMERDEQIAIWKAENARFDAWLAATVGEFKDWSGMPNRIKQLEAAGGMIKARADYKLAHNLQG